MKMDISNASGTPRRIVDGVIKFILIFNAVVFFLSAESI